MQKNGTAEEFKYKRLGLVKTLTEEQVEYRIKLRDVVLRRDPWCLIVAGTKGNGKSYLAQVAINTLDRGEGLYTTQPLIENEIRGDKEKNGDIFYKYITAQALVVDELSDRPNDWTEAVKTFVENILIERHRNGLPTVLIGNVTAQRIVAMFDVRIRDRLQEGLTMVMTAKSLRRVYDGN